MQEPRQLYGLGSFVKKITKPIKKIVKSPIGKDALLGAGAYFAGGGGLPQFMGGKGAAAVIIPATSLGTTFLTVFLIALPIFFNGIILFYFVFPSKSREGIITFISLLISASGTPFAFQSSSDLYISPVFRLDIVVITFSGCIVCIMLLPLLAVFLILKL